MNAEKQYQEIPARIVQEKRDGETALQMTDLRKSTAGQTSMLKAIQRQGEDEEELLQGKGMAQLAPEEEEELMQGKFVAVQRRTENQTGIPDAVKQKMEDSFQTDFSSVRVHPDSSAAPEVGALAYTQGPDIHFAPGQFKPGTVAGQQLLGHELAHVVQQRAGRVEPTVEIAGMPVNDNPALEHEADMLGEKAANE